jgi:hypothetical protein
MAVTAADERTQGNLAHGGAMNDEYEALAARIIELVDNDRQNPTGRGPEAIIKSWLRDFAASRERAGREAEQSRCAAILETTAELVERALTMTDALKATAELRVEAARYRALARRIRGGPESTPDA